MSSSVGMIFHSQYDGKVIQNSLKFHGSKPPSRSGHGKFPPLPGLQAPGSRATSPGIGAGHRIGDVPTPAPGTQGSKGVLSRNDSKMRVLKNGTSSRSRFQSWNMFKVHQPTLRPQHSGWVSSHWLTLRSCRAYRTTSDLAWRAEIAQRHHFPPAHSSQAMVHLHLALGGWLAKSSSKSDE